MDTKTNIILQQIDHKAEEMKAHILEAKDVLFITGTRYFVSSEGDDNNDGLSESTPWKSLQKASDAPLKSGDGVFLNVEICSADAFTQKRA